jgi:STE24 endopeptidase
VPELLSVVAHEVGHYKMRHIVKNTVLGIAHTGVMLYLLSVFLHDPGLFAAFYVTEPSVYAGLVFFGMLYAPVELKSFPGNTNTTPIDMRWRRPEIRKPWATR